MCHKPGQAYTVNAHPFYPVPPARRIFTLRMEKWLASGGRHGSGRGLRRPRWGIGFQVMVQLNYFSIIQVLGRNLGQMHHQDGTKRKVRRHHRTNSVLRGQALNLLNVIR